MYNKKIYDEWQLHVDATQHEINFKFLEKSIKILSIKKLTDPNNNQLSDEVTLKRWKKMTLNELLNAYNDISSNKNQFVLNNDLDFFFQYIINLAQIIVTLRKNNIKLNDLEYAIEPKLFMIVVNFLSITEINQFYNVLLQDVFGKNLLEADDNIKFSLRIEDTINIRNTVWNLENLCLSFKEISKWYQKDQVSTIEKKKHSLNLMLVYHITNFYIRYINELNGGIINFNRIYNTTIYHLHEIIKEGKPLVLIAFKLIAIFFHLLVKKYNFDKNDSIIENYLAIIRICCNDSNVEKLKNIIFNEINGYEK